MVNIHVTSAEAQIKHRFGSRRATEIIGLPAVTVENFTPPWFADYEYFQTLMLIAMGSMLQ